jgi:hypothetical protein
MRVARRLAGLMLLAGLVTGCTHKAKTTPPAQAQAPSTNQSGPGALYPPPLSTPPPETQTPAPPTPATVADKQQPPQPTPAPPPAKPKKTPSHRRSTRPSTEKSGDETAPANAAAPPADQNSQVAANGAAPAPPAIGQLSTDDAGTNAQSRQEAQDLINATENGVNNVVKKPLNQDQQNTVTQIRTFLEKAKQAIGSNDPEGAKGLATKAKVLLDELVKQ